MTHWKTGFLRIAYTAKLPVLPVFFDYPSRTFTLGQPFYPAGDLDTDMLAIRALFRGYHGKYRDTE